MRKRDEEDLFSQFREEGVEEDAVPFAVGERCRIRRTRGERGRDATSLVVNTPRVRMEMD